MKKTNYSLMLSEGVVNAIDREAARLGTNRSALINRILAEYVSYETPEMRAKEILSGVLSRLGGDFRTDAQGDAVLSLSSSLAYRYRPTVRYSLELYRGGERLGEIRVSMRTQNENLLRLFEAFALAFAAVENRYLGECEYTLADGRFSRVLRLRREGTSDRLTLDALGALVARYVSMLDRALKLFCRYASDPFQARAALDAVYRTYLSEAEVLL
jgi:hypothetical protein